MWTNELFGFSFFGTMKHGKKDSETLKPAKDCKKIDYPKPDGVISFDKLSSVFLSNTNHEEDQPIHLKVARMRPCRRCPNTTSLPARPTATARLECMSGWKRTTSAPKFQINSQNCVHCKTCDIKDPNGNITWTVPEGAGGPNYPNM